MKGSVSGEHEANVSFDAHAHRSPQLTFTTQPGVA
jgi:hypothetical protein